MTDLLATPTGRTDEELAEWMTEQVGPLWALFYFPPPTGAALVRAVTAIEPVLGRRVARVPGIARAGSRTAAYGKALRHVGRRLDQGLANDNRPGAF